MSSFPGGRLSDCLEALLVVAVLATSAAQAGQEVRFFQSQARSSFLEGELRDLEIGPLGTIRLGDRARRLASIDEPFLFTAAAHRKGWVLGTGNSGNVLMVSRQGDVKTIFSASEPEIFALHVDSDGTIYAGSSPNGKVYRIKDGRGEEFFDPQEIYIWAMTRSFEGELLVATGTDGKLFSVDSQGKGRVVYDSKDSHLRALKVVPGGDLIIGTAGLGLVLRLSGDGRVKTLFDAAQPEVVALTTDPEGIIYAALLASEASLVDLSEVATAKATPENGQEAADSEGGASTQATVVVETDASPAGGFSGSRPNGFGGSRSEVVRIGLDGVAESLWQLESETIYSLSWSKDRLWVGTGLEGKIFSVEGRQGVLQQDLEEKQVVAFLPDGEGWAFATTNPSAFYRIGRESVRSGTYTSESFDAEGLADFGSFRWEGELAAKTTIRFSFRSGLSSDPDDTWSEWTAGKGGRQLGLEDVSAGRYFQWRGKFEGHDFQTPELRQVTISYRQRNVAPRIVSVEVLDPGQILVPSTFNPTNQVYEPANPNRQGIFSTVVPVPSSTNGRLKTLWKYGYRTLRWEAEDVNQDDLMYRLSFRTEVPLGTWMEMERDLKETYFSFDATALPEGIYRFRVEAVDRDEQASPPGLTSSLPSESVLIDHSPPALSEIIRGGDGETLRVSITDSLSPLREAVFSVDAGEWRPLLAVDGMLDERSETFEVPHLKSDALLLLRVTDAAFNAMTFNLLGEPNE